MSNIASFGIESHRERVLVSSTKARSLLMKYAGYTKDRKCVRQHKELTRAEFRELCTLTSSDFPSLSTFLNKLNMDTRKMKSPPEFREFFAELAKNSPACGIFQVRSEQKVFDAVTRVVSGSMDLFKSSNHAYLTALQTTVPILVNFVQASKRDHRGRPSDEVCDILQHILEACKAPFQGSPPSSSHYAPPVDSMLAFFPSLPNLVGPANYFADSARSQANRASTHVVKSPMATPLSALVYSPSSAIMVYVMAFR